MTRNFKRSFAIALTLSTALQGFLPSLAQATYGNQGGGYNWGHHGRPRVPDPKAGVDVKAFRLSANYLETAGQPTGSGSWSDAASLSTAIKDYVEGACVPVLAKVKNESEKKGDLNLTLTYEYEDRLKLGVNDLEGLTAPTGALLADNLNDFTYTNTSLANVTSFSASNGGTVAAQIEGPYAGENTGSAPVRRFNGTRHYNLELQDVEPGVTVYVTACAQLSMDPKKVFSFFDRDEDDDHYGFRFRHDDRGALEVKAIMGGHVKDKALISKDDVLNLPSLTLVAKVNGTGAVPSQFTFHVSPAINGQSTFTIAPGRHSVRIQNVPPQGAYTVTETGPSGFAVSSGSGTNCAFSGTTATASPVPGLPPQNAKCVFENGPDLPANATLTVTKIVVNNNGGTKTVTDFPLFVNGNAVSSGVAGTYEPGLYTVTEATSTEYIGTFSGDCDVNGNVTLTAGAAKQCILTNDDVVARLVVNKIVVNNNGGTKTVADFPLFVDGEPVESGIANVFGPGTHAVSEQADAGYQPTFSGDCDVNGNVTLALGQTKFCTLTNDDIAPKLTVTKVVVNDNGGTAVVQDFPLFVNGNAVSSGVAGDYAPGSYTVTEASNALYDGFFSGDCDVNGNVTLAVGDVKECVVTNDDKAPKLTVVLQIINDQGGANIPQDFPLFVNGNPVTPGVENVYAQGSYVVTQTEDLGYILSFSGDCDFNGNVSLAVGDVKTCIVKNNDLPVGLTIVTKVINDNGGVAMPSDFTTFIQGVGVPFTIFQGNNEGVSIDLGAGPYNVGQVLLDGYDAFFSAGCFGFINEGERLVCTITNTDL